MVVVTAFWPGTLQVVWDSVAGYNGVWWQLGARPRTASGWALLSTCSPEASQVRFTGTGTGIHYRLYPTVT